ncbi:MULTISPECIES: hypothetical protein [unclassified Microcoleus]|uniref:hypothetical protein n=1 Tax=unclassified Microcoleus TaxID=2642155 RepID=UPI002FCE7713
MANIFSDKSSPAIAAYRSAAAADSHPVPQATSSNRIPRQTPTASNIDSLT